MSAGLRAGTNNDGHLQINGTDVLSALSSGKIGVNVTNPLTAFDVLTTENYRTAAFSSTGYETNVAFNSESTGGRDYRLVSGGSGGGFSGGSFGLYDTDAAAIRFAVTSSGDFAIGHAAPTAKFHVGNGSNLSYLKAGDTYGPQKYYKRIDITKVAAAGTADAISDHYIGRFGNGLSTIRYYCTGYGLEEGFEITISKVWGSSNAPRIINLSGFRSPEIISFHAEHGGNDQYDLFFRFQGNANAPAGQEWYLIYEISTVGWKNYVDQSGVTIPTLDSANLIPINSTFSLEHSITDTKFGYFTENPATPIHIADRVTVCSPTETTSTFSGLYATTADGGRAQLILSSAYSDLILHSIRSNDNHGSTLTFVTENPADSTEYRKFVINQGNWGTRKQFLEFGYEDSDGLLNPHWAISDLDTVLTLDGINKKVGIGGQTSRTPYHTLEIRDDNGGGFGATIGLENRVSQTGSKVGIFFGVDNSASKVVGETDYANASIVCNNSGVSSAGELKFYVHTGSAGGNKESLKIVGDGNNRASAGTSIGEACRGGVAFGNAGFAIDRAWGNYPGFHVFSQNVYGDTTQGEVRFHGWNTTYASYPNSSGADFSVNLRIDGGTYHSSDRRHKTNIVDNPYGLDSILQLQPRKFNRISSDGSIEENQGDILGFIAQEVIEVIPEAVKYYADEDEPNEIGWCRAYSLSPEYIVSTLVNAVKELSAKNDALEARIAALEG